jgi:cysteine-rich repeat protein
MFYAHSLHSREELTMMRSSKIRGTLAATGTAALVAVLSACGSDTTSSNGPPGGGGGVDAGAGGGFSQAGGQGGAAQSGGASNSGGTGAVGGAGGAAGASGAGGTPDASVSSGGASGGTGTGGGGADGGGADASTPKCGNGAVDPGEACDPTAGGGAGCKSDCTWVCSPGAAGDAFCDDHQPCNGAEACGATHVCTAGTNLANGTTCGSGLVCQTGNCAPLSCGNGTVETPEECDDGNQTNGDGCETNCKLTCKAGDASRDCSSVGTACTTASTCDASKHTCSATTPANDGNGCGNGNYCKSGSCVAPVCGNGQVELGEMCDDGNQTNGDGCQANCTFTCVAPADCGAAPACKKQTCTGAHLCVAVADTALNGSQSTCAAGNVCSAGSCVKLCGNGVTDAGEDCDDGANGNNLDGCTDACKYSCANPATDCSAAGSLVACQKWSCNTASASAHFCQSVTDSSLDGAVSTCPVGNVCSAGSCSGTCGNGIVNAGEQCDDGNKVNGDGCNTNCTFSCQNPATDCAAASVCMKQTCTGAHVCQQAADTAQNGALCSAGHVCAAGTCTTACGNGALDTLAGEQCDFGSAANGPATGCETTCQYSCQAAAGCADGNACNGTEACSPVTVGGKAGQKCTAGTSLADGAACGAGSICVAATCQASVCGDGIIDAAKGEECDFGAGNNGAGTGCEATCKTSCHTSPSDTCNDGNLCNGVEVCNANTVNGKPGKKCTPGTNAAKCTACPSGLCSGSGACAAGTCGDGCVSGAESCEPPNTSTCNGSCQTICDLNGVWAAKLVVPVTWTGSLLNAGSGTISIWSLMSTTQTGTTLTSKVLPCDIQIPPFKPAVGQQASITFPNSLFDHVPPYLTAADSSATVSASVVGGTFNGAAFTSLIGMSAPASGAWPTSPVGVTEVDQDKDSTVTSPKDNRPGVTAIPTNVPDQVYLFNPKSIDEMYLALRQTITSLTGTLTSCTNISGSAVVANMDSHVLGCHIGGAFCDNTQSTFVDDHRPIYVPGTATVFKAVKVANTATCATVRGATFP